MNIDKGAGNSGAQAMGLRHQALPLPYQILSTADPAP